MIIVFDSETRQFSAIDETREFGVKEAASKVGNWANRNRSTVSLAGGSIVGGTAGTIIARKQAKKKAAELGLEPGTPEYKKFMSKQTAKGAAIGVAGGAAAGYLGKTAAVTAHRMHKHGDKFGAALKKGASWK